MTGQAEIRRSYDAWRPILDAELDVLVVDDEGRRRAAREHGLDAQITRRQAEACYRFNAFVRRRRAEPAGA